MTMCWRPMTGFQTSCPAALLVHHSAEWRLNQKLKLSKTHRWSLTWFRLIPSSRPINVSYSKSKILYLLWRKVSVFFCLFLNKEDTWYKTLEFPCRILFSKHFCNCQEEKCSFSASLFDCITRRESSFPSSPSFLLSPLMMTNTTRPSSNRNFRDDKCALYFSRACLRLLSQPPKKCDSERCCATRLWLADFEWRLYRSVENSVKIRPGLHV